MKKITLIGIILLSGAVLLGLAHVLIYATAPSRLNILLIGSDQRGEERARSDVLMVVSFPKSPSRGLSVLTIPRDTRVDIPGYGIQKIAHAYALGDRVDSDVLGNVGLTRETVEQFLGIPIHGTAEFTFASFQNIVDFFGGVDTAAGHLTGEEALAIVRDRFREGGDFARTQDQREIFVNLFTRVQSPRPALDLYNVIKDSSDARLRFSIAKAIHFAVAVFIRNAGHILFGDITEDVVPGQGDSIYTEEFDKNLYYWIPDTDALDGMVERLFSS